MAGQDWNTNPIVFTVKIRSKHTVKIRSKQCQNYLWISFLRCKRLRTGELTQVLNFVVNLFLSIKNTEAFGAYMYIPQICRICNDVHVILI